MFARCVSRDLEVGLALLGEEGREAELEGQWRYCGEHYDYEGDEQLL